MLVISLDEFRTQVVSYECKVTTLRYFTEHGNAVGHQEAVEEESPIDLPRGI